MTRAGRLSGKTVLVTGGTTGIGFASAELFLREDARVLFTGQNAERVVQAAQKLGPNAHGLRCDAGRLADLDALAEWIAAEFGTLDVLLLNAGIAIYGDLDEASEAVFDETFAVNVKGVLFAVQRLAPLMRDGGSIIVTTSINNRIGMAATHIYAASKAASGQLVRTLAGELAPRGIRVNALCPGPVITEIAAKTGWSPEKLAQLGAQVMEKIPLRRFGAASELASAALFLASSESSFITGQEIVADGGWTGIAS